MLNEDYKDILQSLHDAQAEFILVGAYALAVHGFPRATMDIDIWVSPTKDNAHKVHEALAKFGAPMEMFRIEDLVNPDMVFQLGVAPRRIDLMTSISGVSFAEAAAAALSKKIEGIPIKVLSVKDLIRNKSASGRPKDFSDVEYLKGLLSE
jgi:hypothetical protein